MSLAIKLFDRRYDLRVDTIQFQGNRIEYDIEKTLKPDPNKATISIYNIREHQRKQLSSVANPVVRLSVGYKDHLSQIFYGQLIHVEHEVDGPNVITHLTTGDGINEYRTRRVAAAFGPKAKAETVFQTIVKALGLKDGNAKKAIATLKKSKAANIYLQGTSLSGSAAGELTQLCRSCGLEWSIQDQTLQFLDINQSLDNFAIVLDKTSGLIGSPTLSAKNVNGQGTSGKGVLSFECLAVPELVPGRQIQIKSRWVSGVYRLEKINHKGDSHGRNWGAKGEATELTPSASVVKPTNVRKAG